MNILADVKPEKCFYCADGSVLHNLYELEKKLRTISPEAFYHHVSQSKNDFHNWIRDVFQDYALANRVLRAKTPAAAAVIVRNHVREALLAQQEIENAIRKAVKQELRLRKAAYSRKPKQKSKQPRYKKPKRRLKKSVVIAISTGKIRRTTAKATAAATAAAAKKMKIKKIRKRQHGKNRKLNKKQNQANKGQTGKGKRSSSARKRGKSNSSRTFLAKKVHQKRNLPKKVYQKPSGKRKAKKKTNATIDVVKKHIKKHVGQWLKWLSVNPKV